jgi:catechol 2,3-dioxygenase-like lactoylglutathione lyase family enzyme
LAPHWPRSRPDPSPESSGREVLLFGRRAFVLSGSEDHVSQKGRVDDGKGLAVSHIGICVSDLDASLRFYCEGLGFEIVASHEVGEEFAVLMELDGVRLRSRMIRRDGVTLELLDYVIPGTIGRSSHSAERSSRPPALRLPSARRRLTFSTAPIPTGSASS